MRRCSVWRTWRSTAPAAGTRPPWADQPAPLLLEHLQGTLRGGHPRSCCWGVCCLGPRGLTRPCADHTRPGPRASALLKLADQHHPLTSSNGRHRAEEPGRQGRRPPEASARSCLREGSQQESQHQRWLCRRGEGHVSAWPAARGFPAGGGPVSERIGAPALAWRQLVCSLPSLGSGARARVSFWRRCRVRTQGAPQVAAGGGLGRWQD